MANIKGQHKRQWPILKDNRKYNDQYKRTTEKTMLYKTPMIEQHA
jgi:hypothetical protein